MCVRSLSLFAATTEMLQAGAAGARGTALAGRSSFLFRGVLIEFEAFSIWNTGSFVFPQ